MARKVLDLKLGYECNNNCIHCVITKQKEYWVKKGFHNKGLNTDFFLNKIKEAKDFGCSVVVFTGGEPTIRGDFLTLLEYTYKLGLMVHLQSNGRRFCDFDFAKKTVKIGAITNFAIAFNGHTPQCHDSVTQSHGSFDETLNGIKNLLIFRQNVSIKYIISYYNYKYIYEFLLFIEQFKDISVNFTFPGIYGNALENKDKMVTYSDLLPYLEKGILYANEKGIRVSGESIPPCIIYYPGFSCELEECLRNDEVYVSQIEACSNISKEKHYLSDFKTRMDFCEKCCFSNICVGVGVDYVKYHGKSEFKPIKELQNA